MHAHSVPATTVLAEAEDGLLLATVHMYFPAAVTVRVWVYCAVTGSFNTVWVPWVTVVESLVQVTVVTGPPVEIQVRVSWLESNVTPPDIEMSPEQSAVESQLAQSHINFMALASNVHPWLVSSINTILILIPPLAVYSPT